MTTQPISIEQFRQSLCNLIIRKDAISAELTNLIQQIDAHVTALESMAPKEKVTTIAE